MAWNTSPGHLLSPCHLVGRVDTLAEPLPRCAKIDRLEQETVWIGPLASRSRRRSSPKPLIVVQLASEHKPITIFLHPIDPSIAWINHQTRV